MRVWLVTARNGDGNFIDQRRIEANNQSQAERDGYDWIIRVGGRVDKSTVEEIRN